MKNINEIKLSVREHAEKLLAQIIESRKMLDMYEFVHNECWRDLSFDSLQECVDEYDCPSYSTFRRNYNAAVYQITYLPGTVVGVIKESTLRVICKKEHRAKIKLAVAQKILKADKGLENITEKDIEAFIQSTKIVLSPKQMTKAFELAQLMVTNECLDEIDDYIEQTKMSSKKQAAFIKQIGVKVWSELKQEGQSYGSN